MDLLGTEWGMIEKAFAQVREIPVRMSGGSHALVDLHYMHTRPRHVLGSESAQHHPRRVATAYGHKKTPARGHRRSCVGSNDCGSSLGHRVGAIQHFNVYCLSHA